MTRAGRSTRSAMPSASGTSRAGRTATASSPSTGRTSSRARSTTPRRRPADQEAAGPARAAKEDQQRRPDPGAGREASCRPPRSRRAVAIPPRDRAPRRCRRRPGAAGGDRWRLQARAFIDHRRGRVRVARPGRGGSGHLPGVRPAEVDLRVTVIGERLIAAAIHSQELPYPLDFRLFLDRDPGCGWSRRSGQPRWSRACCGCSSRPGSATVPSTCDGHRAAGMFSSR